MAGPPTPPDSVSILIALGASAGVTMSPDASGYLVLLLSAVGGAVWAAQREEHKDRLRAALFVMGRVGLTVLVGTMAAAGVSSMTGWDWRWLIGPVSGFIAAVGPMWLLDQAKAWLARRHGSAQ